METPDEVIIVRPEKCAYCQANLQEVEALGYERRQKVDLPEIKARVTEYQAQDVPCPHCQQVTRGIFPDEVRAAVQFGPTVKGIALYLLYGQLLPYARTAELLTDLCGCHLSPGTLETFVAEAADRLVEAEEQINQALQAAEVDGTDETSIRVVGILYWLHVVRTDKLTGFSRSSQARQGGHRCHRYLTSISWDHGARQLQQLSSIYPMRPCPLQCSSTSRVALFLSKSVKKHFLVEEARARGETHLPPDVIASLTATYHQLIEAGLAAQPPPADPLPKKKGRIKQTKAKNLLDRLQRDAAAFLLFLSDFRVPFEQDLRMVKVEPQISGTFRSETGPVAFCRIRGYFSTMAKQGYRLCTVARQIFVGTPLSPVAAL